MRFGLAILLLAALAAAGPAAAREPLPPRPELAAEQERLLDEDAAPSRVRRALARARLLQGKGDLDGAREALERVAQDGGHHLVWYQLGGIFAREDSLAQAAAAFARAVALAPRLQPAWRNLGEVSYVAGDYAAAAAAFDRAVELDPWQDPELIYYQGVTLLQAGRASAALAVLDPLLAAADAEAPLEWYRGLVAAAVEAGQAARADGAMARLTAARPEDPQAWDLAYRQAAAADDLERAVANLTVRGYLEPLDRAELIQLGDLCLAIGTPARAVRAYRRAMADGEASAGDHQRLIGAHLAAHDETAALAAMDVALAAYPDARTWRLRGEILYGREEFAAALEAFTAAARLAPEDRGLDLMRGYCALELERTAEAVRYLEEAAADERYAARAREALRHIRGGGS